jgi:protocatechuate 3,4-dioxygenase alpha subunit
MTECLTPSQTVGPFFAYCLTPGEYPFRAVFSPDLTTPDAAGARIRIEGRIVDGDGAPVPDAMVEIWQADGEGRYRGHHPALANAAFRGFGRAECDPLGGFAFTTVKPGRVPGPNGTAQAPHIAVGIFARGLLIRLITRIYFPDEDNAGDPVLALVPEERRGTLVSVPAGEGVYRFDIRLQGEGETVFFEA